MAFVIPFLVLLTTFATSAAAPSDEENEKSCVNGECGMDVSNHAANVQLLQTEIVIGEGDGPWLMQSSVQVNKRRGQKKKAVDPGDMGLKHISIAGDITIAGAPPQIKAIPEFREEKITELVATESVIHVPQQDKSAEEGVVVNIELASELQQNATKAATQVPKNKDARKSPAMAALVQKRGRRATTAVGDVLLSEGLAAPVAVRRTTSTIATIISLAVLTVVAAGLAILRFQCFWGCTKQPYEVSNRAARWHSPARAGAFKLAHRLDTLKAALKTHSDESKAILSKKDVHRHEIHLNHLRDFLKHSVESIDETILGVDVTVGAIHINALQGIVEVADLAVENCAGYCAHHLLVAHRLYMEIDMKALVASCGGQIIVSSLALDGVNISYETAFCTSNLQEFIEHIEGEKKALEEPQQQLTEESRQKETDNAIKREVILRKASATNIRVQSGACCLEGRGMSFAVGDIVYEDFNKECCSASSAAALVPILLVEIVKGACSAAAGSVNSISGDVVNMGSASGPSQDAA